MAPMRWANGRLALAWLAAIILAGCAQQKAYERGARLSEQGQYQQAVAELERAIALAEQNHNSTTAQRYRETLVQTKRAAGAFYYRDAQLAFEQADLAAAQSAIELSLQYQPMTPQYTSLRDRIGRAIAEAERLRAAALSLADQQQWQEAVARMNEALRVHRTLPRGAADFKAIQDRAYEHHVNAARSRLFDSDLAAVEAEAQSALLYREDGREAEDLLQTVSDRREAASLVMQGQKALQRTDYEEALRLFERARRLHPSRAGLPELLNEARHGVCDRWLGQGREALAAGANAAALALFRRSAELLPGYGDVDALAAQAESRLAAMHLQEAERCFADDYAGAAVLHATAALGYTPTDFEAQRQLGVAIGQVQGRVRYTIDFVGFEAAPGHREVANLLEAATLQHLLRAKPANVVLVERVDEPRGAETAPRDDAVLAGEVLDSRVTSETQRTGQGESVYQDGFRPEPNPDYVAAAAEVDAAIVALEHAREVLAEAQARLARYERADPADADALARRRRAQADVAEAQQRLINAATKVGTTQLRAAALPREVLVPNMVKHTYPIDTVTWAAQVSGLVKLLDTATGELLLAERIDGRHAVSDAYVPADLARNVPEDPLELPAEGALLEDAVNSMMARFRQVLDAACSKHGDRFVAQVRQAKAAGDATAAVDGCIKYLFAYPRSAAETDAMVTYLRSYLGAEDELLDLTRLLQMHCRVLQR